MLFLFFFCVSGVDLSTQLGVSERHITKPGFLPVPKPRHHLATATVSRPPAECSRLLEMS